MIPPDARRHVRVIQRRTSHSSSNSPVGYNVYAGRWAIGGMRPPADSDELSRATTSAGGSRLRRGSYTLVI
eukprot:scaffold670311_cov78-Prasinocladus_malaysianus.AAC.1